MIAKYPVEMWNGGKVHHIVKDKIIHLMRGQVFNIESKTFFTFGGAKSYDVQGGILDRNDIDYDDMRRKAIRSGLPYRVIGLSWWKEELPTEEELQEGRDNLEKVGYKVDYVISHCASNRVQDMIEMFHTGLSYSTKRYETDILTDYFEKLEDKLQYKQWICGHYHDDVHIDEKHTVLYTQIIPLADKYVIPEDDWS